MNRTAALLSTLILLGCGGPDEVESAKSKITVHRGDEAAIEYTIEDEEGTVHVHSSEKGVELPPTWPSEIAMLPDAKIETSATVDRGQMVVVSSANSAAEVVEFYKRRLNDSGWKITLEKAVPAGATLTASKDASKLSIVATTMDETSEVNIVVNAGE